MQTIAFIFDVTRVGSSLEWGFKFGLFCSTTGFDMNFFVSLLNDFLYALKAYIPTYACCCFAMNF